MIDFNEILKAGAAEFDVLLSDKSAASFAMFKDILLEWNKKVNLTALTSDSDMLIKHFLDSLSICKYVYENASVVDVGTGAGFPGVPLVLAKQGLQLTLMDSLKKRVTFLEEIVKKLDLPDVKCVHTRAEDAGRADNYREKFNVAVSRAVAELRLLAEYCLPLVAPGGVFIAMKGPNAGEEIATASEQIDRLGGEISVIDRFTLPFSELTGEKINRTVVIIKKIRQTPLKYPRKSNELLKIYNKNKK